MHVLARASAHAIQPIIHRVQLPTLQTIIMLKTLIIAMVLLPMLAFAQQSQQLPQPRQTGQWCPVGWVASGNYCVPGSDKAPQAVPKNGWCPSGWRESGSYCIR